MPLVWGSRVYSGIGTAALDILSAPTIPTYLIYNGAVSANVQLNATARLHARQVAYGCGEIGL